MEPKGIDELLNETPDEAPVMDASPEPEVTPEPEAPVAEGQPRGPDGKFAPKQTGVEEPAQPEPNEAGPPPADQLPREVYEPLKAVRNENRELKQQIEALQRQFAMQQQQPAQPEQPVDFWENPNEAMARSAREAAQAAIREYQQQQTMERINASEKAARDRHADYDDAFRAFHQAAQANPALIQQMTSESDPAEFAYKKGKTALQLEQVGSIDELIAAERAKWEQEARAAIPQPAQTFPQTTATDGSVGARSGPAWSGPPTIDDLLRR